jgi:hypothetical protein
MAREVVTWETWRGPQLTAVEVAELQRGIEAGHITVDPASATITGHFDTAKPPYQLFMGYDGGAARPGRVWSWSWREGLAQLAFASELVVEHHWQLHEVALELAHLDVDVGTVPRNQPVIAAEVKLRDTGPQSLAAMLAVFTELAGGPAADWVNKGDRANAVPKYQELLELRPPVFCAVAPGVRRVFTIGYDDDRALLRPSGRDALTAPAQRQAPSYSR